MKVRALTEYDIEAVLDLFELYFSEEGTDIPLSPGWREMLDRQLYYIATLRVLNVELFLATKNNYPVGMVMVHENEDGLFQPNGSISSLFVKGDYRGRGAVELLIERAREWFTSRGIRYVRTEVRGRNMERPFYFERESFEKKALIVVKDMERKRDG